MKLVQYNESVLLLMLLLLISYYPVLCYFLSSSYHINILEEQNMDSCIQDFEMPT